MKSRSVHRTCRPRSVASAPSSRCLRVHIPRSGVPRSSHGPPGLSGSDVRPLPLQPSPLRPIVRGPWRRWSPRAQRSDGASHRLRSMLYPTTAEPRRLVAMERASGSFRDICRPFEAWSCPSIWPRSAHVLLDLGDLLLRRAARSGRTIVGSRSARSNSVRSRLLLCSSCRIGTSIL